VALIYRPVICKIESPAGGPPPALTAPRDNHLSVDGVNVGDTVRTKARESVAGADGDFEDFVNSRGASLLRSAYLLCGGDRGAAEDLLQDVLERMYPRWRRIRGQPEAYARAALANAAVSRWRLRSRRVAETFLDADAVPAKSGEERTVEERDAIVRALAMLPPRARAVVVLRYFEELTEVETASALGCSVGTVKSQSSRALTRLRELLSASSHTSTPAR
jgi:RNA polymerase sigma-70 factor (sigma-E family)